MTILIYTDAEIIIILCQGFSDKNILSLLSDQLKHIFDDLYRDQMMMQYKLGFSTVDDTTEILWSTFQSHYVMAEFSKHAIKCHSSLTSIFARSLIKANISEPLQEISQMRRNIKVLRTK